MLNPVAKAVDPANAAAVAAFLSNRDATRGCFKKPGQIKVAKPQSTGRKTRIRHDLRKWLAETRTE